MSKIAYQFSDNWKDFTYDQRFLDAFAAAFHVQGDCSAVLKYDSKFYLSYNSNMTNQNSKRVDLISKAFSEDDNECLLGLYLVFNVDFKALVKKSRNHVGDFKEKLENFLSEAQKTGDLIDKNINKINSKEIILNDLVSKVVLSYGDMLQGLNTPELKIHLSTFFRPKQDVCKAFDFYKTKEIVLSLEILSNPSSLHAEYNISINFPKVKYLDENYIGISKLSCGYCHKSLTEEGYGHRGTHGVCDNTWKMSSSYQEDRFKDSATSIQEFNQDNLSPQYRRLSIDDFEQKIEQFYPFKEMLGLCELLE